MIKVRCSKIRKQLRQRYVRALCLKQISVYSFAFIVYSLLCVAIPLLVVLNSRPFVFFSRYNNSYYYLRNQFNISFVMIRSILYFVWCNCFFAVNTVYLVSQFQRLMNLQYYLLYENKLKVFQILYRNNIPWKRKKNIMVFHLVILTMKKLPSTKHFKIRNNARQGRL